MNRQIVTGVLQSIGDLQTVNKKDGSGSVRIREIALEEPILINTGAGGGIRWRRQHYRLVNNAVDTVSQEMVGFAVELIASASERETQQGGHFTDINASGVRKLWTE